MTNGIDEDVLERLEAEAKVADADAEELTLAVESDIEDTESQVEELQAEVEEKESEVEELQSEVEAKEEEIEQMAEKVNVMAEEKAEELAEHSEVMDAEDFLDKFSFEELQEKASEIEVEEVDSQPSPNGGDPGAGFQSPEGGDGGEGEDIEMSEKEELAAQSFRDRARQTGKAYWNDIAEDIEEGE